MRILLANDDGIYAPPHLIVKPKMVEGDEWKHDFRIGDRVLYSETQTVGGAEKVETPAGEFFAVPIRSRQNSAYTTFWYADGVGLVKIQRDGLADTLLKSYRIGAGK